MLPGTDGRCSVLLAHVVIEAVAHTVIEAVFYPMDACSNREPLIVSSEPSLCLKKHNLQGIIP